MHSESKDDNLQVVPWIVSTAKFFWSIHHYHNFNAHCHSLLSYVYLDVLKSTFFIIISTVCKLWANRFCVEQKLQMKSFISNGSTKTAYYREEILDFKPLCYEYGTWIMQNLEKIFLIQFEPIKWNIHPNMCARLKNRDLL